MKFRIGHNNINVLDLDKSRKFYREAPTMVAFAGFCIFYMRQRLTWDYLQDVVRPAGAAFFRFRNVSPGG